MADDKPQLYLASPRQPDMAIFPDLLARIVDSHPVACLRLDLATRDEDDLMRAADTMRAVTEPRDVALVMTEHFRIAQRTGLDGVHLPDGSRTVRKARGELGGDAIVGAFCGASRHEGINAGEAGADYVAFGPMGLSDLGDGTRAEPELFAWWSEMIEIPVVAEGHLDAAMLGRLATITDFVTLGDEVWSAPDPLARLGELLAVL